MLGLGLGLRPQNVGLGLGLEGCGLGLGLGGCGLGLGLGGCGLVNITGDYYGTTSGLTNAVGLLFYNSQTLKYINSKQIIQNCTNRIRKQQSTKYRIHGI